MKIHVAENSNSLVRASSSIAVSPSAGAEGDRIDVRPKLRHVGPARNRR